MWSTTEEKWLILLGDIVAKSMVEGLKKTPEIVEDAEARRLRELRQERRELGVLSHVFPKGREHQARLDAEIAQIRKLRETLAKTGESEAVALETQEQPGKLDRLRSRRDQLMAELGVLPAWKALAKSGLVQQIVAIDRQTAKVFNRSRAA